jgi:hypothetical protein
MDGEERRRESEGGSEEWEKVEWEKIGILENSTEKEMEFENRGENNPETTKKRSKRREITVLLEKTWNR